jgi:hypothetical protein
VDSAGNAHIAGETYSTDFPATAGAPQISSGGDGDVFVTKLDSSGSALLYSTHLGDGYDAGNGVAVDAARNGCFIGGTNSSIFRLPPRGREARVLTILDGQRAWITAVSRTGAKC